MKSRIVKIGEVGVDSGQLMICDPCYIEGQYKVVEKDGADHGHNIYKHKEDGKLWQFTYGSAPKLERVNQFPGTYEVIIPEYGLSPNDLIQRKVFEKTDFDKTAHIPLGEFSYRGICKTTDSKDQGGQLDYSTGVHGVAVAFRSGFGDGTYNVFAELV